jgi:hypothetical protein
VPVAVNHARPVRVHRECTDTAFTEEVCGWFDVNFAIDGFWPAFVAALVISAVGFALDSAVRRNMFGPRWG